MMPRAILTEILRDDLRWWWLSFCDGHGFLGACLVRGYGVGTAALGAYSHGCNPGGEVLGFPAPDGAPEPPEEYTNRLLTREECEALNALMVEARHGRSVRLKSP